MRAPRPAGYKSGDVVIEVEVTETPPPAIEISASIETPPELVVSGHVPEASTEEVAATEAAPEGLQPRVKLWELRSGCPGNTDKIYGRGITPKRAVLALLDVLNMHINVIYSVTTRTAEDGATEHVFSRHCGWPIIVREVVWEEHTPKESCEPLDPYDISGFMM